MYRTLIGCVLPIAPQHGACDVVSDAHASPVSSDDVNSLIPPLQRFREIFHVVVLECSDEHWPRKVFVLNSGIMNDKDVHKIFWG